LWILDAYEKGIITEQEFKSMLPEIKQHAQINLNSINDTFNWVNVQRYDEEIEVKDVNSYDLVSELKDVLEESIKGKKISVSQIGDPHIILKRNPSLLRFILNKILENATKYSYIEGEVEVETRLVDSSVHFFARDKGIGIS